MTKILSVDDFLCYADQDYLIEALRINDEFNNTNNAEFCEETIKYLKQSSRQVAEYIKLIPDKAEDSIDTHNREITKMMILLAEECELSICQSCGKYFLPMRKEHSYCEICWNTPEVRRRINAG